MKHLALLVRPAAALAVLGLASCGGDLTLPGTSAEGLAVRVIGGDLQQGAVGEPLPDPVIVEVKTEGGVPIGGRRVAFVASAEGGAESFDPDTAVTNSQGQALTRWKLPTAPGTYMAEARVVAEADTNVLAVSFQADAIAGSPDTVRAVSPASQPGRRGQPLAEPLRVKVLDRFGNPVSGAEVEWKVSNDGDGSLSEERVRTDDEGVSSVVWTLGGNVGVQRAEARIQDVSGSPVNFVAVVLF
jgi:hypothetical protein